MPKCQRLTSRNNNEAAACSRCWHVCIKEAARGRKKEKNKLSRLWQQFPASSVPNFHSYLGWGCLLAKTGENARVPKLQMLVGIHICKRKHTVCRRTKTIIYRWIEMKVFSLVLTAMQFPKIFRKEKFCPTLTISQLPMQISLELWNRRNGIGLSQVPAIKHAFKNVGNVPSRLDIQAT